MSNNVLIVGAWLDGELVAADLNLYEGVYMHAHLGCCSLKGRDYSASSLVQYMGAVWGFENGIEILHLGGGYKSGEDSLYKFKKSFSLLDDLKYYIGKRIHDKVIYNELCQIAYRSDDGFNDSTFFPGYRKQR